MPNLTLQYNCDNYVELVHMIAGKMETPVRENAVEIPEKYGTGFVKAKNLPGGLSVLICDITAAAEIIMVRLPGFSPFYVLQFSEVVAEASSPAITEREDAAVDIRDSFVVLFNGQLEAKNVLTVGTRARSLLLIFERRHLLQFLSPEVADNFLSNYFTRLLQTGKVEPLDADYRALLDMLLVPKIHHPLPSGYLLLRCMLLLERFILNVMSKMHDSHASNKLSADEINRLMKVEARLVKDFAISPPTIESLAKSAAMSPTKLKKDFKLLYGLPMYEYFQHHRMNKARRLLMETQLSIKEIGIIVGYSNLSHFAAGFKKEFGLLPSEFSARDAVLPIERIG